MIELSGHNILIFCLYVFAFIVCLTVAIVCDTKCNKKGDYLKMSQCRLSDELVQIGLMMEQDRFVDAKTVVFRIIKATGGLSSLWTDDEIEFLKNIIGASSDEEMQELSKWV